MNFRNSSGKGPQIGQFHVMDGAIHAQPFLGQAKTSAEFKVVRQFQFADTLTRQQLPLLVQ